MPSAHIVGGGLAGLSAAVALSAQGFTVTVLERGQRLGGRASSWPDEVTGDVVDIGPHVLMTTYQNMRALLQRLGTASEVYWQHRPFITLVEGRRAIVMRSHRLPAPLPLLPSMLAAPSVSFRDKWSNSRATWFALRMTPSDLASLDTCSGEAYLKAMGVSPRMRDWFWRSLSMFLLNIPLDECSAAALLRLYAFLISHNHCAFGFPKVGLGELYAPAARMWIEARGGQVRLACGVRKLALKDGAVCGLDLDNGESLPVEHCILAVPPHELQDLLPDAVAQSSPFAQLRAFKPSHYISCYLWFEQKLTRERFWARPWTPQSVSCEYYDLSNIRPGYADRGSLIATNIIDAERIPDLPDELLLQRVRAELEEYLPQSRHGLRHARVHRIPMAVPRPYVGMERRRLPTDVGIPKLYLAGDWTATDLPACMEGAVRSGFLAADAVLNTRGEAPRWALPPPQPEGLARWLQRNASTQSPERRPPPS